MSLLFKLLLIAAIAAPPVGLLLSIGEELIQVHSPTPIVEVEREPANPQATPGIGEGRYDVPTDLWLHPGYAAGVSSWTTSGDYIGVSRDKSLIVFASAKDGSPKRMLTAYNVKTGATQWTLAPTDSNFTCHDVHNGIAYCIDETPADTSTFLFIDLATGALTKAENIPVVNNGVRFFGHWQGFTYWATQSTENTRRQTVPETLLAIKDGKLQWQTKLTAHSRCVVGDGALGCGYDRDDQTGRIDIFNASTGDLVADYDGTISVEWYRDGYVITDTAVSEEKGRQYSWTGKEIGEVATPHTLVNPGMDERFLHPLASIDILRSASVTDPEGQILLEVTSKEGYVYRDTSTGATLAHSIDFPQFMSDEKGAVYVMKDEKNRRVALVDQLGKELFAHKYGESTPYYQHGILYEKDISAGKVTVFAPRG